MREHLRAIGRAPHAVSGLRLLRALLESHHFPICPLPCYATDRRELVPQGHVRQGFHSDLVGEKATVCSTAWPKFDSSWQTLHCSCCVMCRLCQDLASTRFRAHAWRRWVASQFREFSKWLHRMAPWYSPRWLTTEVWHCQLSRRLAASSPWAISKVLSFKLEA